jgi:hypothetical protein
MDATTIYGLIKDLLSSLTGIPRSEINAELELRKDPLRFTEKGTRDLAQQLNTHFANAGHPIPSPGVHPDQTQACKKVRQVSALVRSIFEEA